MNMKPLNQYIQEKLIINKDYSDGKMYHPKSFDELRKIIEDRYKKLGPGTKQNPIDFNDIDVSNIDSFCAENVGIFEYTKFKYIDISYWDVLNVYSMRHMFYGCKKLESVGDISKWNVSSVTDMAFMFYECKSFNQDLSDWNVSSVTNMSGLFYWCESFNQDISKWNVLNVITMSSMFLGCTSFNQDLSKWNVSKVKYNILMFNDCPIKEEYKPKFK